MLMYCQSSSRIESHLAAFEGCLNDVEVPIGNLHMDNYVDLKTYFEKNWGNCCEMWMSIHRKNIPELENENTNNRLERTWRSVKEYLKQLLMGEMSIAKAVMHIVNYCETRLLELYTWDQRPTF